MLLLECIDATNTRGLEIHKEYYGFPINESAAYISRFPRKSSHTGCYQLSRFKILKEMKSVAEDAHDVHISEKTNNTLEIQLTLF